MPGRQEGRDEQALTGDGEGKEKLKKQNCKKSWRRPRRVYGDLLHNLSKLPIPLFASFTPTSLSVVKKTKPVA